jgi:phosphoglycerol transferase
MSAPFAYDHDAIQNLMVIKNTLRDGWPLTNQHLGAPFGSELYDFPVVAGDSLHLLVIHVLGLLSSDPAFVANSFFLLSFPLAAATAAFVLERLGLRPETAVVCAVLFALAPYHFFRGETHLFLQAYYGLPLGIYLAMLVAAGTPLRTRHGIAALVVMCAITATTDVYFAVFVLLLLGLAILVASLSEPRRPAVRDGLLAFALVAALVGVQHLPSAIYRAEHGADPAIAALRWPSQSETFGMRTVRLVLPVDDHRIPPLASVVSAYNRESPAQGSESSPQALGTAAAIGFIFLIGLALVRVVSQVGRGAQAGPRPFVSEASMLTVAATLIATAGGFSLVLAYLVTDTVRSWGRMSIVIAFLSLFAFGVLMERLRPRLRPAWAWPAVLACVIVLGSLDQAPTSIIPAHDASARSWRADDAYFNALERRLPRGAMVYNAPYYPFPERPLDAVRGYLHTDELRFSFGAVEGRSADWPAALSGQPGGITVPAVSAAGFSGILVDAARYPDGGAAADADLRRLTGATPFTSRDGNLRFYDLRAYRTRLAAALGSGFRRLNYLTLHPVRIEYGAEFSTPTFATGAPPSLGNARFTDRPRGTLVFVNPSQSARPITVDAQLVDEQGGGSRIAVAWPDGVVDQLAVGSGGVRLQHSFSAPPGRSVMRIASSASQNLNVKEYLSLRNVTITDQQVAVLARRAGSAVE